MDALWLLVIPICLGWYVGLTSTSYKYSFSGFGLAFVCSAILFMAG